MGTRFRKSVKIAPGVKLNISKGSVGISAGVKGARVSVNSKGRVTKTVGIPETGISHSTTTNLKSSHKRTTNNENTINNNSTNQSQNSKPKFKIIKKSVGVFFAITGIYGLFTRKMELTSILTALICFAIGYFLFTNKKKVL